MSELVRRAQSADARAIWEIRNERTVRDLSAHTAPIEWEESKVWFETQYGTNSGNFCFVLAIHDDIAGYCRFDKEGGAYRLSIALAEKYRGRGLGRTLLEESLTKLPRPSVVHADVLRGNEGSYHLFAKSGFIVVSEDERSTHLELNVA